MNKCCCIINNQRPFFLQIFLYLFLVWRLDQQLPLFYLFYVALISGHSSLREAKAGTWRWELKQKITSYWSALPDLPSLLSSVPQDRLHRASTTHIGLGPSTYHQARKHHPGCNLMQQCLEFPLFPCDAISQQGDKNQPPPQLSCPCRLWHLLSLFWW